MSSVLGNGPDSLPSLDMVGGFGNFSAPFIAFYFLVLLLGIRGLLLVLPQKTLDDRPQLDRLRGVLGVLMATMAVVFALVLYAFFARAF